MQVLTGHTSPETAYVVADYPYGFRLRCQIRYWIETTKHGQRFVSQTSNPKREGLVWNKPKVGTYSDLMVMYLASMDGRDMVFHEGLSIAYSDSEKIEKFATVFADAMTDEHSRKVLRRGHRPEAGEKGSDGDR